MADKIICPVCGAENFADQKVCHHCQTPLVDDALFQPGQAPSEKDTGELEPLMPQWLRDARQPDEERKTPPERPPAPTQQPPQTPSPKVDRPSAEPASSLDFLASLGAQADDDDEEEIPDWLASITGESAPKKESADMPSGIRWAGANEQSAAPEADDTPDWLADLRQADATPAQSEPAPESDWFSQSESPSQTSSADDTPDWLKSMQGADATPAQSEPAPESDWFSQSESPSQTSSVDDTPDWLKSMQGADATPAQSEPALESDWFSQSESSSQISSADDTPDWLKSMQSAEATPAQSEPAPESDWFSQSESSSQTSSADDTPDWLKSMQGADATPAQSEPAPTDDTPDWLKGLPQMDGESAEPAGVTPSADDAPDWLNQLGSVGGESVFPFAESASAESAAGESSVPSWLQSPETPEEKPAVSPFQDAPFQSVSDDLFGDMPDWLKSAAPDSTIFDDAAPADFGLPKAQEAPKAPTSAFSEDLFADAGDAAPAEIPDWLSSAMSQPSANVPAAIEGGDALAPDILPSWVEAMRPSDQSGMAGIVRAANEAAMESKGALSGISGALPFAAGFAPTSKPKAYGLKLNASADQLKHAEILEQILAAETSAPARAAKRTTRSARGLRWAIGLLLLLVALFSAFSNSQIFAMPNLAPRETLDAISLAQGFAENAPILVVADYDAARFAEMESAAAPLFDGLLLLKHPRLTFISNREMGAALVERLMNGALAFHTKNGATYLNLGYLAGGQAGVRAFAENPRSAAPLDVNGQPAWDAPQLQDVVALDQFALVVLVADNADSVRVWVEQTESARGATPLLVVSSAQAAPLIQPYYESGQVRGIISGVFGGALLERHFSGGRPGIARSYWDAYSVGMLLAAAFLILGGLVNFGLGLRERSAMKEGK
ncbi:MAG: hypothetical protein LC099_10175 [Anaerolineales bacterium]|nr:hypothetical protein [Anaerolineales bacterium]